MTFPQNPYGDFDKDGLPVPPPKPQNAAPADNPFGVPQPQQPQMNPGYGQPMPQAQPQMQPQYGMPVQQQYPMAMQPPKQMIVAALLAFFFGGFGIHNFYLGYTNRGLTQLILMAVGLVTSLIFVGLFICMAVGIWALVDFIMILAGSSPYDRDAKGVPLQR
ncbi:TM2 domain-containing protein [Corynebacterium sp. H130]|uniref:TM2 domain-containing protein n=1 Tax=Corynebacterium sp. H130 TaxID=3133444 RepID=UPI0030B66491